MPEPSPTSATQPSDEDRHLDPETTDGEGGESSPAQSGQDYKSRWQASSAEARRLKEENDQFRAQQAQLLNQAYSRPVQQPQQPPPPQWGEDYLTEAERSEYDDAVVNLNSAKQRELNRLMAARAADQASKRAQAETFQAALLLDNRQKATNWVLSQPEVKDRATAQLLARETQRILLDPAEQTVHGGNEMFAFRLALERHRSEGRKTPPSPEPLGQSAPDKATPAGGSPTKFDPQKHMTRGQRAAARVGLREGETNDAAYKRWWNGLAPGQRRMRMEQGPLELAQSGQSAVWRTGKRKSK